MRLIDADKLISKFEQIKDKTDNVQDCFFLDGVMAVIDEQPTVEPVRRGMWEHTCVCSECGHIDYSAPNYCPNCGSYNGEEEEKL